MRIFDCEYSYEYEYIGYSCPALKMSTSSHGTRAKGAAHSKVSSHENTPFRLNSLLEENRIATFARLKSQFSENLIK